MMVLISMATDWLNLTTAVDVDNAKLKYNAKTNDIRLLSMWRARRQRKHQMKREQEEKSSDFYRIILHDFISVNSQTCRARTLLPTRKYVCGRESAVAWIAFWSHRIPVYGSIVSILIINRTLNWVAGFLCVCFVLLFVSAFVSRRRSQPVDYCIYGSHIGFLCVRMKTSVRYSATYVHDANKQ